MMFELLLDVMDRFLKQIIQHDFFQFSYSKFRHSNHRIGARSPFTVHRSPSRTPQTNHTVFAWREIKAPRAFRGRRVGQGTREAPAQAECFALPAPGLPAST
jgi:hypothetical protein